MNISLRTLQLLVVSVLATCFVGCSPMKISMKSGSAGFLKEVSQVNVEYNFDAMRVGKFVRESEYLDKKAGELNAKEPGKGDKWRQAWLDDRSRRFAPHFEDLLNKQMEGSAHPVKFGSFKDAKYTLVLKTTFTEPGWNIGISARPAFIDAEASFVETQNRANSVAVVSILKAPGMDAWGFDFDTGSRLQESYAKAGKELGNLLRKKLK